MLKEEKFQTKKGLSPFKTVCMSLGTTMGTGNIVGTAAALAAGGPGAVFWMWVSAFLGMALVCAENLLSAKYSDDKVKGPMAYISKGLGCPWLSRIFAFFCVGAALGMGSMVQVNTFCTELEKSVEIPPIILFSAVFAIVFPIIKGGAKRIGSAAQILLPFASAAYAVVCIVILIRFGSRLPDVFSRIFTDAFSFEKAAAGGVGYAVSIGLRRGIFSNEAGLGSSPILHSAADASPKAVSAWAMLEVFLDTVVCCTLTALAVMCASEKFSVSEALSSVLGGCADIFLTAELGIFALCTVIGWYYCGKTAFGYLTGERFCGIFCIVYASAAAMGAVFSPAAVWSLSDIFNGLMAFPNLLALIFLVKEERRRVADDNSV